MYIASISVYGSVDCGNGRTMFEYLHPDNENFGFEDESSAKSAIIDYFIKMFPYEEKGIRQAFATNKDYEFRAKSPVCNENGEITGYEYCYDMDYIDEDGNVYMWDCVKIYPEEKHLCHETFNGQGHYDYSFSVHEVTDPVYLVIENFIGPRKYIPNIERAYTRYMENYDDAKNYMADFKMHDDWHCDKQVYICCENRSTFDDDNIWYKLQCEVIDAIGKNTEMLYDDTFHPDTECHLNKLTKSS